MNSLDKMFHSTLSVVLALIVFIGLGLGFYGYRQLSSTSQGHKVELELLNKNYISQNQQTILLKVVDGNLKNATIDQKVRLSKVIYDLCTVKQVPIHLICAMIEHESTWNPEAKNGDSGATGLMQLIPRYALPYMRCLGIREDVALLRDPVYNVSIGIAELADAQTDFVLAEKTKSDDFTLALHSYAWGRAATYELFGKSDKRVNVPNLAYPNAVLGLSKKYKEMGL